MRRFRSTIDLQSAEYRTYERHNRRLAEELHEHQRKARYERPQRDIDRLRGQKKLLVHERIGLLLDPETPFLELSTLAANKAYDGAVPGAGVVSGIGIIHCFLNAGIPEVLFYVVNPLETHHNIHHTRLVHFCHF